MTLVMPFAFALAWLIMSHVTGKCTCCNTLLKNGPQAAVHLHSCQQSGSLTHRHDVVKHTLYRLCQEVPILFHVEKEQTLSPLLRQQDPALRNQCRADILMQHPIDGDVMLDVSITHPLGATMFQRQPKNKDAALEPQSAIQLVEQQKYAKYAELQSGRGQSAGWKFYPLAMDVYGQLSQATHQFITWLQGQLKHDDYIYGYETPANYFEFSAHIYTSLSISLIRANALVARRATRRVKLH